jgi:hypothetical protein
MSRRVLDHLVKYPPAVLRRTAALGLLLMLLPTACGSKESAAEQTARRRQAQARDVAKRAGLPPPVQDFMALFASAASGRFDVSYAPEPSGSAVEVIQDGPLRRVDLNAGGVTRSLFVTRDGTFNCALQDKKWLCQRASQQEAQPGLLAAADIERAVAQLQSSRNNFDFKVTDRKVAGVKARCLVVTPKPGGAAGGNTLCLSPQGAVLVREEPGASLRASHYTTDVDSRRLKLPAPPEPTVPPQ